MKTRRRSHDSPVDASKVDDAWTSWPPSTLHLDYRSNRPGVGPGEERVAVIMDGVVQGGNVSYDILCSDGYVWEVKEPHCKNIRTGTEGMAAAQHTLDAIKSVASKLHAAFTDRDNLRIIKRLLGRERVKQLREIVEADVPMILKGELSKGRVRRLREALTLISVELAKIAPCHDDLTVALSRSDRTIPARQVSPKVFAKIGSLMGLASEDLGMTSDDAFSLIFDDVAFHEPERFLRDVWDDRIKASQVFGHTDGVILVNERDGYRVVPKTRIDAELRFDHISVGKPYFRVS